MADTAFWQTLLREALAVLALPTSDQVRANGPGCVACDLLNDFDHAHIVAVANAAETLSDEQRKILESIENIMDSMQAPDFECFNNDVLNRPIWQRLRGLAVNALHAFGWECTVVEPFVEIEPGIWRRPNQLQTKVLHSES